MIEPTDEMLAACRAAFEAESGRALTIRVLPGIAAVLAIVERDYYVSPRATPEQLAALPKPRRRLRVCVENWPGAEIEGGYDPRCCRWPKPCSASVYDDDQVRDEDLESAS